MIKYRPHRGGLVEAMMYAKIFENIDDLKRHICEEWNIDGLRLIEGDDIVIGEIIGDDNRVGWKNIRYVLTKRCGAQQYAYPQCIGICTFDE